MTTTTSTPGALDVGRAFTQTFAVIGRNLLVFLALAVLFAGGPYALLGYATLQTPTDELTAGMIALAGVALLLIGVFVMQAAVVYAAVSDLNGRRAGLGPSLAVGFRHFLPLLGLAIVMGFALILGFMLFIVPGLILITVWAVAAPSLVMDNTGVFGAFTRSADLTRNNRWRVFGFLILLWVVSILIQSILNVIDGAIALGAGSGAAMVQALVVRPLFAAVGSLVGSVGAAVLYFELRRIKEGVGAEALAEVFA